MAHPFRRSGGIVIAVSPLATPADLALAEADFAAPLGRRVRLVTAVAWLAVAVMVGVDLWLAGTQPMPASARAIVLAAPLVVGGLVGAVGWFSHIGGYRLTRDELIVVRRRRETRFALAGLVGVEVDPEATAWSVQIFGNDGCGAITGRYRNRRLGAYQALVTDRPRAVVLRWPERCLVVSPDRPEEFAHAVRRRAGLRS